MNRDDRLFAIIGGSVVTAAASVFLLVAGGITGSIDTGPEVRVSPIPAATVPPVEDGTGEPTSPAVAAEASDLVVATFDEEPAGDLDMVRAMVAGISSHPQWAAWLVTDDLLYRFVAAVEAVADGYSPVEEIGFVRADGPFLVREDEDRLVIAAGTYRRYNLAVEVLTSIDVDDAVEILHRLSPEIEDVRGEVAWHRGDFEDRLRTAIDHLLEVEIPAGPVEVERRTVSYAFADDRYESLSGAQRQLLRMGGSHAAVVQDRLRELRAAFGWPEAPAAPRIPTEPEVPTMVAELSPDSDSLDVAAEVAAPVVEPMITPFDPRLSGPSPPWIETGPIVTAPSLSALP
jgi:hypothetical protein